MITAINLRPFNSEHRTKIYTPSNIVHLFLLHTSCIFSSVSSFMLMHLLLDSLQSESFEDLLLLSLSLAPSEGGWMVPFWTEEISICSRRKKQVCQRREHPQREERIKIKWCVETHQILTRFLASSPSILCSGLRFQVCSTGYHFALCLGNQVINILVIEVINYTIIMMMCSHLCKKKMPASIGNWVRLSSLLPSCSHRRRFRLSLALALNQL